MIITIWIALTDEQVAVVWIFYKGSSSKPYYDMMTDIGFLVYSCCTQFPRQLVKKPLYPGQYKQLFVFVLKIW